MGILLLVITSPLDKLTQHLASLPRELIRHPLVSFALRVVGAFRAKDYSLVLRLYSEADFLTAAAMSGIVDLARCRVLWLIFQSYPRSVGDRISVARLKKMLTIASTEHLRKFLSHYRVEVEEDSAATDDEKLARLPKRDTPQAEGHPLLT